MLPVYCEHFGLTREPFNVTPDPSFLYLSASHKEALAQLVYGIRTRRGFVVLTGEVGTGKTTLIQSLLEEMNDGHTHCAFLFDLTGSPKDLLRSLCEDLSLISPSEKEKNVSDYLNLLNQFLLKSYQKGDNVALIIDEAQNLSVEVLERVRLLSNFETKQDKLLQILLVGQPELGDRLNEPELRQLKQRIALRYHLRPLSLSECKEYIAKRLAISGGAAILFTEGAIRMVHTCSGGMPRLVNILCDNGLLSAYAQRKHCVEPSMIEEIAQDLHLTVPRRGVLAARENGTVKTRGASLREAKERVLEIGETAEPPRQSRVNGKPGATKPSSSAGPMPAIAKTGHQLRTDPKSSANGSNKPFEPVPACVPLRFFDSMIHALTEAMGPMAAFIVQDHVAALGESKNNFPIHRLEQLLEQTSSEIDNESMKDRYWYLMSKEIKAIDAGEHSK